MCVCVCVCACACVCVCVCVSVRVEVGDKWDMFSHVILYSGILPSVSVKSL